jgi:hypothetical protein
MALTKVEPTTKTKIAPARLFMIVARRSPVAVIFRRGPSHCVQLVKWDTENDTFQTGQWFHGRIYERRCDLSPNGSLLIYFAQKISPRTLNDREFTHTWTAISKPPYLTALALWPKGQSWDGGGLFKNDKAVLLNHEKEVAQSHPNHQPGRLHVTLMDCHFGGDEPIFSQRLERDGWMLKQAWKRESRKTPYQFRTVQPEIREKLNGSQFIRLTRSVELNDYLPEFSVVSQRGSPITTIERATWADWDQKGRLVFARDGCIFRGQVEIDGSIAERKLLDLNAEKPTSRVAPHWATVW